MITQSCNKYQQYDKYSPVQDKNKLDGLNKQNNFIYNVKASSLNEDNENEVLTKDTEYSQERQLTTNYDTYKAVPMKKVEDLTMRSALKIANVVTTDNFDPHCYYTTRLNYSE